jgi:hypothetical protein
MSDATSSPVEAEGQPDRMTVEFTLLEQDTDELLKWLSAGSGPNSAWLRITQKQQAIRSLKLAPLVIGGGVAAFWALGHDLLPGFLLGTIVWVLMFTSSAQRSTHAAELRRNQKGSWKPWLHGTSKRLTISAMGVELVTPTSTTSIRWKGVRNVRRWHNLVVVELFEPGSIYIPVRCFSDEAEVNRFIELAVREGRVTGPGDLAALLDQHDFRCPGCKYLLRGNTTGACPECGRHVLVEEVEFWLGTPH